MTAAKLGYQDLPALPSVLAVASDGTWVITVAGTALEGQRTEFFQTGPIRASNVVLAVMTNLRAVWALTPWDQRSALTGIMDGAMLEDSQAVGELVETSAAGNIVPPNVANQHGVLWGFWLEAEADGAVLGSATQSVGIVPGMDIPIRKLNKPVNIMDAVLDGESMAYVPPNKITRAAGDFTTQVKARDDILAIMDAFGKVTGRVESVIAGEITLYADHGKDSGGNGNGGLVVSTASDGT